MSDMVTSAGGRPLSKRGARTRRRLLEAAEAVFAELGYHEASIVKITEAAGVGQGTFYLYFASKKDVFDELVVDLNHRVRQAMTEAASQGKTRAEMERLGFAGYFRFVAEHPALYRIIRQAEFVSPESLQLHYERLTSGYVAGLRQAMEAGEIAEGDPELLAWALMGIGELVGMRWILWAGRNELPAGRPGRARPDRDTHPRLPEREHVSRVGLSATAHYLPERWMTAEEVGAASGIPEHVIVEKFGLRGKHVAADDEHVSDLAVAAGLRLLEEQGIDPRTIGALVYYGSTWKDYPVWQAAPWIAHRLGCSNAYAIEYDNVSMGTPVALRFARALLTAEPELRNVLLVAASRESYLLDYTNERSRFMFNFGDGAVAGLLEADADRNLVLGCHAITDGSFSLQVKVPAGGSVEPASHTTVDGRRHYLDVADPAQMKGGLDEVSLPNFVAAAKGALARSGATLADVSYLCGIHMKRSMHEAIVSALGLSVERAAYLDDTGHMSGVDPLLALDRAVRAGEVGDGDLVLLLAAGTGYTWAASTVRLGPR